MWPRLQPQITSAGTSPRSWGSCCRFSGFFSSFLGRSFLQECADDRPSSARRPAGSKSPQVETVVIAPVDRRVIRDPARGEERAGALEIAVLDLERMVGLAEGMLDQLA